MSATETATKTHVDFASIPLPTGPAALLNLLRTIRPYERWEGKPLSASLDRWVRREATEQELLTLGAAVLTRLMNPRR